MQTNVTYFLHHIDSNMTLVAMYDSKKAESDAFINNFFLEMAQGMRVLEVFTKLKPGNA